MKGHPWVTYSIAALCVALFALEELWGDSSSTLALLRMGANPGRAALRTPWTLLSSAFLHIGLMHLLFNMAALLSFGPLLERVLGWRRYVVLYALSALGGGMASALGHEVIVSAGASGALWGLMVGGAGLAVRPRDVLPRSVVGSMRKQVWTPVLINLVYSFQPGVDLLAHLGGGVVGGALLASGLLTIGVRREGATMTRSSGPLLQGAAALSALAMAASIAVALIVGQPWTMGSPPPMERREIGAMGLSIEVPVGFATTRDEHSVAFGRFDRDPIVVEVIHAAAGSPRSAEELAEGREAFGKVIDELRIEGATRVGAAVPVKVGALDTFRVIDKLGEIEARTWAVALEGGDALVRVYVTPGAPREWVALRDRFIASLRVAE